jgi:release factor glutamine methyltransferase
MSVLSHYIAHLPIESQNKIQNICKHRCIYKTVGAKYFWKYIYKTNTKTLTPRDDTEMILEILHNTYTTQSTHTVLELGVGTGALIMSTLLDFQQWTGIGIELSYAALKVARRNLNTYKLSNRLKLVHNNWLHNVTDTFDILIANPPYLQPHETVLHVTGNAVEPHMALFEPQDLFFYKRIASAAKQFKHIIMEISSTRPESDYTQLFSSYKHTVHYLNITTNNNVVTVPFIIEVFPHQPH